MIDPLVTVRDFHLASTLIVAGIVFFDLFIVAPIWQTLPASGVAKKCFQSSTRKILWASLALSIASALAWLCLLSMRISGKSSGDVITDGTIWRVLSQTQFGFAWQMRLLLGGLLAVCLWLRRANVGGFGHGLTILAAVLVAAYLGSLAFAGHGAEGLGAAQNIHLVADFLHLNAAGLWLGALVPLVLLLAYLARFQEDGWALSAADAGSRFSTSGILAVGILLVSGTVNAAFLLGGMHSLIDTAYGRLLLLKIVLFAAMVSLAGINRQYLLPRLHAGEDPTSLTVRKLIRSAVVEMALGFLIVCIVGLLGITPPATEMIGHMH